MFPEPFRTEADLDRLRPLEPLDAPYVTDAVKLLVSELDVPLIGFAGAPFTVASYLVEGGPSRTYVRTKALMHGEPALFRRLLFALADLAVSSLRAQIEAGAAAVQLFDSWAGALSPEDYRTHVLPATRRVFDGLADLDVPRIHYGLGTGLLLADIASSGADVVGLDFHVHLDEAWSVVGDGLAVQGNLDPSICLAPWDVVAGRVDDVLARAAGRPGHVFNLGHGVLPQTDTDLLRRLVDLVHEQTGRSSSVAESVA
jgi:uroporphyrinogen decarboxylase